MKKIIMIDGGIGRVICATPAIEKLAQSHEVVVVTHWLEVFLNNYNISRMYHPTFPYLFDDVIKGNELISPEPYHYSGYYNGGVHLITAFDALINESSQEELKPKLYLSAEEIRGGKATIENLKKECRKPIICIQPFSASYDKDNLVDNTNRSIKEPLLSAILNEVDAKFINFGLVPIEHDKVINLEKDLGLRKHFSMVAFADYCIGIDSVMCHVAAAFDRVGTFFYGATDPKQVGYERFQNIARVGFPKGHQSFRLSTNPMLNYGAMDFTEQEIIGSVLAIKEHMKKCELLSAEDNSNLIV